MVFNALTATDTIFFKIMVVLMFSLLDIGWVVIYQVLIFIMGELFQIRSLSVDFVL